jgi:hypothetical protein
MPAALANPGALAGCALAVLLATPWEPPELGGSPGGGAKASSADGPTPQPPGNAHGTEQSGDGPPALIPEFTVHAASLPSTLLALHRSQPAANAIVPGPASAGPHAGAAAAALLAADPAPAADSAPVSEGEGGNPPSSLGALASSGGGGAPLGPLRHARRALDALVPLWDTTDLCALGRQLAAGWLPAAAHTPCGPPRGRPPGRPRRTAAAACRCLASCSSACGAPRHSAAAGRLTPHGGGGVMQAADATLKLATHPADTSFFQAASTVGLRLFEPFGGICSGLEAVLRAGMKVKTYYYADNDATAHRIAAHRIAQLSTLYPAQFLPGAADQAFIALPQDVHQINLTTLAALARKAGGPWLTVAGFPCQDLSQAGKGRGVAGKRSSLFYPLLRLLRALQLALPPGQPPVHIVENTSFQYHPDPQIRTQYEQVCQALGPDVTLDAAQFGSRAHRLRHFWQSALPAAVL